MTQEEKAIYQWNREVLMHVRGFKVSDLPVNVVTNYITADGQEVDCVLPLAGIAQDPARWDDAGKDVMNFMLDKDRGYQLPKGWSYRKLTERVAPGKVWGPLDLPNPRYYSMAGEMMPNHCQEGDMAKGLERSFTEHLGCLWQLEPFDSPPTSANQRRGKIFDLLDYHDSGGGNQLAFRDFIEELSRMPENIPPPSTSRSLMFEGFGLPRGPLNDGAGLAMLLQEWSEGQATKAGALPLPSKPKVRRARLTRLQLKGMEQPSLASKFGVKNGSYEKWIHLLRSEGLVDRGNQYTLAAGDKGKGKIYAAWIAAHEVFGLEAYPKQVQLTRALLDHFHRLSGLDRLDKVRMGKAFTDTVARYKEVLQDD